MNEHVCLGFEGIHEKFRSPPLKVPPAMVGAAFVTSNMGSARPG